MIKLLAIILITASFGTLGAAPATASARNAAVPSASASADSTAITKDDIASIKGSIEELRKEVAGLKNDSSKYWLLALGGLIGALSSVLTAIVSGVIANKNKILELRAISTSKTKELLVNQVIGFEGKTQPRAAILAAIKSLHHEYPDLKPLFREFLVSQMEYLITHGENTPLEQSNALVIVKMGSEIFSPRDRVRIVQAHKAHPDGSDRGMALNAETMALIDNFLTTSSPPN